MRGVLGLVLLGVVETDEFECKWLTTHGRDEGPVKKKSRSI